MDICTAAATAKQGDDEDKVEKRGSLPFCVTVTSYLLAIGFNVETVQYKNIKFQVWDLGGQTSIRPYWRCYYANTDAVIYVVDSVDRDRVSTAKEELMAMLEEDELKDASLLVFANKQDMHGAMSSAEVSDALGLSTLMNRQWSIYKTSAVKGEGLTEGLDWYVIYEAGSPYPEMKEALRVPGRYYTHLIHMSSLSFL